MSDVAATASDAGTIDEKQHSSNDEMDEDAQQTMTEEERQALKKKKKKEKEKAKQKEKKAKEQKAKEEKEGKKKNKTANLIQEAMQRQREREEELRRLEEERIRQEEELQRKREEEELAAQRKKEEAKKRKQDQIAQQKREGTFLTKKQKQQIERARQILQNQNIIVPSLAKGEEGVEKPKKPYYGKKKPQKKLSQQEPSTSTSPLEAPQTTVTDEKVDVADEQSKEDIVDDWEAISDGAVEEMQKLDIADKKSKSEDEEKRPVEAVELDDEEEGDESEEDDSESDTSSVTSNEALSTAPSTKETKEAIVARVRARIEIRREQAMANMDVNNFRSPIICVLGHVDTGKTKMLDTIRRTNVQDGEAGGITQQIGATRVPDLAIMERCKLVKNFDVDSIKIPGFLIIDTPGHESFANLRNRGSSLCDIAILVVDIMHGLEPQTLESIKLLKKRATPFVVALNKVDRLYGYESNPKKDIYQHLKAQSNNVQLEFKERFNKIVGEFAEQGLNVALSTANKDYKEYISVVPTSAMNGDGVGNLIAHIMEQCQTRFVERIRFIDDLDCTVMEVRAIAGLGTTIDVILVNGTLKVNDTIILSGMDGPIVTEIRDLLMPPPLREIRIKAEYQHYKEIRGAQGVKVLAKDLEQAVAGLPLYVARAPDEIEVLRDDVAQQLEKALTIKRKPEGVYVQASTLGSLEALLEFLKQQKIPVSNVNIGPVHKRDVQKAAAMLEHNAEFACILAFDVPVSKEVQLIADREGVRIFQADIIYHLEDSFLGYREELRLKKRKEHEHLVVYPCKLRILPQNIFKTRSPIVIGVAVEAGQLRKGTPICAKTSEGIVVLGTVSSIERNHDHVDSAKAGDEVCIKIENTTGDAPKMYNRHFTFTDPLISRISRESIDVCKTYFREDLTKLDWQLIIELKKHLNIM